MTTALRDAAGSTLVAGDGRRLVLGKLVKSGGAGSVYRVRDQPTLVAKLYHANQDLAHYERRIAAMLELTPQLPDLEQAGRRIVQIAWPQAPLRDGRGRFVGFLMPAVDVDATSEVECVLQERQARRLGLPTGLGAKVTLAANLAVVIAELHRQHHYVVDLKPVNLRFYRESLYMAMLDCDGFSIQGHGERFEAPQFTPDYLAPEFHAHGIPVAGEEAQDRFALAVVVFQLLNFGIHPFTGRPVHDRVPTDIPSRIAGRWYAHGILANASLLPMLASGHAAMPAELRVLFDRAFDNAGHTRPAAGEWANALRGYAQRAAGKLLVCSRVDAHQHFLGLQCAACARDDLIAGVHAAAEATARTGRTGKRRGKAKGAAVAAQPRGGSVPAAMTPSQSLNRLIASARARARAAQSPPFATRGKPYSYAGPRTGMGIVVSVVAALVILVLAVFTQLKFGTGSARVPPRPVATTPAVQLPAPSWVDLDEQENLIIVLSRAIVEDNMLATQRGLLRMRAEANGRARGRPAGAMAQSSSQHMGWARQKLLEGDFPNARRLFVGAIWADADNGAAWFGYGLTAKDASEGVGAIAIAILLHPDAATARATRAEFAAYAELRWPEVTEAAILERAGVVAEATRPQLDPGTVPLAEPFSWDPP